MATQLRICPPALSWNGFLLGLALLGLSYTAGGQNLPPSRSLALKVVPQHLIMSGYWAEAELQRLRHSRQSFTLTPQLYSGPAGSPNDGPPPRSQTVDVRGFGVQAQHRFYLLSGKAAYPSGLYVSYGPHLQYFQTKFSGQGWREVIGPGDLPYLEYGSVRSTDKITRYGASVQAGYQAPLLPGPVFVDVFVGLGWRQTHTDPGLAASRYRSGSSDYAHRGFYIPAGVKIGVALSALRSRTSAAM